MWRVGKLAIRTFFCSFENECSVSLTPSQCTVCRTRKSIHAYRGDYEEDRKDVSAYGSDAACHPKTQSWRYRLSTPDGLSVY
jgi:hypothetical protein